MATTSTAKFATVSRDEYTEAQEAAKKAKKAEQVAADLAEAKAEVTRYEGQVEDGRIVVGILRALALDLSEKDNHFAKSVVRFADEIVSDVENNSRYYLRSAQARVESLTGKVPSSDRI